MITNIHPQRNTVAMPAAKKDIISKLQNEILLLQGLKPASAGSAEKFGLGPVEAAFPNAVFPTGAMHEFLNEEPENAAACSGFISCLLSVLMQQGSACLWISASRTIFPPALKAFGLEPDRIIFVDLKREKDVLWAMEEALKCEGLAAVACELNQITFAESRRLQLVVEKSKVTGFILRSNPEKLSTTACAARWSIRTLASEFSDEMPGVGFPKWEVELLKVRNGNPGIWKIEWSAGSFVLVKEKIPMTRLQDQRRKAG